MASSLDAATLFGVNGLVAFVTGAGTGIGTMYAKALAQNGAAKIYIGGRRLEKLQELAESIGPNVIPIQCDVTSKEDISKAVDVIEKDSGYLNLLVANAGINGAHPGMMSPDVTLEEFSERNFALDVDEFTETFRVNVAGVWFCAMAFLKLLDKGNKKGNLEQTSQVIVTSSISSYTKRLLSGAAYGQSKAAVNALIKQLAAALPKWKIRVNGIAPGLFPSEMSAPLINGLQLSSGSVPQEMVPVGRLGEEKDMAAAILHLASQGGAYCNGNVIIVDGARLQLGPATF